MSDVERGYDRLQATDGREVVELQDLQYRSETSTAHNHDHASHSGSDHEENILEDLLKREQVFWDRLRGKGRNVPGWIISGKNTVASSCE